MKLITRLKAKETQIGKILAYYLPTIVVIIAGTLEILQALHLQEVEIPIDLKKWIGILTVISLVLGKLTAKKDETN